MSVCKWHWDHDRWEWDTDCGLEVGQDGCQGPKYLEWVYCPYCGKEVKETGNRDEEREEE